MDGDGKTMRRFARIALGPVQAQGLLHAVECRMTADTLDRARRVIAAREATIDVLRLDPPQSRAPRTRGALSAFRWPSRAAEDIDPALTDQLAGAGLFLPGWYRDRYGEAVAGGDAWAHYLSAGLAAGLAPNPFFDPAWYADTHLGGCRDEFAILHYVRIGARYALATGPLFDAAAYLAADATLAGEPDPLAHFLTRGIEAGRAAIPVVG